MKAVLALALTAGTACAQSVFFSVPADPEKMPGGVPTSDAPRLILGDTVNYAVTAFSTAGGAYLHGAGTHTVGTTTFEAGVPGVIGDLNVTTSVFTVGLVRTVIIDMVTANNEQLAVSGLTVGGAVIDTVRFEMPGLNGGTDFFDDPYKNSAASGTFELLGNGGAVIFSAAAGMTDTGTSFGVSNGITTGAGTDLFSNYITGAHFEISYTVPTPASAALLGLGGLVAVRRRR